MRKFLIAAVFFAALAFNQVLAHDVESEHLKILTDANFNNHVKNDGSKWFVMFFAPWCGHCKRALPTWKEFAEAAAGKVNVATVDCVDNSGLRDRFGIQGFPTFYFIQGGKMYPYKGARTVEAWTNFVESGYLSVEGEEVPLEASATKNLMKQAKSVFAELQKLAVNKPLVFAGVVGGLIAMCALTFWCTSKIAGEDEPPRQEGQTGQAQTQTTGTESAQEKTQERSESPKRGKVKRE